MRAKNRKAQAKYRQKQQTRKQQLVQEHAAAAAQLERERRLKGELQQAGALLEARKGSREDALGMLQAAARADQEDGQAQGCTHAQGVASTAPIADGANISHALRSLPFAQRVELCFSVMRRAQPSLPDPSVLDCHNCSLNITTKRELGAAILRVCPQLSEAVRNVTGEGLIREFGEMADYAAETVEAADAGDIGTAEAQHRVRMVIVYKAVVFSQLLNHNVGACRQLFAHTKLPGETEQQAAARWRQVALDLGMTREQAAFLLPHFRQYLAKLRQLRRDSAAALAAVRQAAQEMAQQQQPLGAGLREMAGGFLQLLEASSQLSQYGLTAFWHTLEFYASAGAMDWSSTQTMRMLVRCRPLHPDLPTIAREVLDHYGMLGGLEDEGLLPAAGMPLETEAVAA